jgi:dTDP-4-amino-4,6-dideoxygalactose transaminase
MSHSPPQTEREAVIRGSKETPPLGQAVVGAGYWGPNLVRTALAAPALRLKWLCDLDLERARAVLGYQTTVPIIPVHLYGQPAPVERLLTLADRIGAWVVEDAAQSQGARRNGVSAGALGHAAATSFYPGKNLGAYGDAGAVLTGSDDVAQRARMTREHGSLRKYEHDVFGFSSRMDALQAVALSAKLRRLAAWNAARRYAAAPYDVLLSGLEGVIPPRALNGNEHVWHPYVVGVPDQDRVLKELHAVGIGAGIHYPVPVHLTSTFGRLGSADGAFPVAERTASELLTCRCLPRSPSSSRSKRPARSRQLS